MRQDSYLNCLREEKVVDSSNPVVFLTFKTGSFLGQITSFLRFLAASSKEQPAYGGVLTLPSHFKKHRLQTYGLRFR